jgi:hypothetical protein
MFLEFRVRAMALEIHEVQAVALADRLCGVGSAWKEARAKGSNKRPSQAP